MNFKEILGLLLAVIGLIFFPVGLAFSRVLWLIGFSLFATGLWMFYTERVLKREEKLIQEAEGGQAHRRPLPSDMNDYTGWSKGGRSETMEDSFDSLPGDGD